MKAQESKFAMDCNASNMYIFDKINSILKD